MISDAARRIMDADQVRRAVARIAHEITERNKGVADVVLIGIRNRGAPLADRIGAAITAFEPSTIAIGYLDITFYRDDLQGALERPVLHKTEILFDINDRVVVLVDDVLCTGRTIRAALDALTDLGRPKAIQLAVLADRGHRELPIRADYVGKNLPTAPHEEVLVRLAEIDSGDGVFVIDKSQFDVKQLGQPDLGLVLEYD